jgi:hypothetical protein
MTAQLQSYASCQLRASRPLALCAPLPFPASCVAVPVPHPWRTEGEGLDEVARRALLAFVSAPQVLLSSGVSGGAVLVA